MGSNSEKPAWSVRVAALYRARAPWSALSAPCLDALVGAGETTPALGTLSEQLARAGQRTDAVRGEMGLRFALSAFAFLMPLVALLFSQILRLQRPAPMVLTGILICALFWLSLVVTWTGVSLGILSDGWLVFGLAAGWSGVAVGLGGRTLIPY